MGHQLRLNPTHAPPTAADRLVDAEVTTPGAQRPKSARILGVLGLCLSLLLIPACSYLVDAVRYATAEDYVGGKEAKYRIETAAYIGYGMYLASNPNADVRAPFVAHLATRIDEDREYLETSVASCEEIMLIANATGQSVENQALAGLFCNMGPGKRADQL